MAESDLQYSVANFLNSHERLFGFTWFHPVTLSPNRRFGGIMKDRGAKAGVPDCCIFTKLGKTLFIELKTKKGSLSPKQKTFHSRLSSLCHPVYVVKTDSPLEAVSQVESILKKEGVL